MVGSLGFQVPEVFKRCRLTSAVDVFAIGAILFKMLFGVDSKLRSEMADGKRWPVMINGTVSPSAQDLLERTLESDPTGRIKMPDLVVHPFLADGPIPQSLTWDILRRPAPLATEDNASVTDGGCQGEGMKSREEETTESLAEPTSSQEEADQTPEEPARTPEEPAQSQEEPAKTPEEPVQAPEDVAQTQEEPAQIPDEASLTQEEAEPSEPAEPYFDPDDIDLLDDIFAEVEAKQAQA